MCICYRPCPHIHGYYWKHNFGTRPGWILLLFFWNHWYFFSGFFTANVGIQFGLNLHLLRLLTFSRQCLTMCFVFVETNAFSKTLLVWMNKKRKKQTQGLWSRMLAHTDIELSRFWDYWEQLRPRSAVEKGLVPAGNSIMTSNSLKMLVGRSLDTFV